jgi:hypothetical protein
MRVQANSADEAYEKVERGWKDGIAFCTPMTSRKSTSRRSSGHATRA